MALGYFARSLALALRIGRILSFEMGERNHESASPFRGGQNAQEAAKRKAPVMSREHHCKRLQGKNALVTAVR